NCTFRGNKDSGLWIDRGSAWLNDCTLSGNRIGAKASFGASVTFQGNCQVKGNQTGLESFRGGVFDGLPVSLKGNQKDTFVHETPDADAGAFLEAAPVR
ncbi:MAG: hypothetical protein RLZZ440_2582, partial [Planctomycetota bacterium]